MMTQTLLLGVLLIQGCAQNKIPSVAVTPAGEPRDSINPDGVAALEQENQRLSQQIETLLNLPKGVSLQDLYAVDRISLGKYTGLYDKDKDGQHETLSVYIKPVDRDGDTIKAAGEVTIQLWDLSGDGEEALVRQWHISPDDLRTQWFSTLMAVHYRLAFTLTPDLLETPSALTVRIRFLDYMTGRVFNDQMPVKSR